MLIMLGGDPGSGQETRPSTPGRAVGSTDGIHTPGCSGQHGQAWGSGKQGVSPAMPEARLLGTEDALGQPYALQPGSQAMGAQSPAGTKGHPATAV